MTKESLVKNWKETKFITQRRVLDAFMKVKREKFVLKEYKHMVYEDIPLPIAENQTISQPSTVVFMTQLLDVNKKMNVLDVGSGCGYQAAILSHLAKKVTTIEINKKLYETAKKNLKNYKNVAVVFGDGSKGCKKNAPYDRILVAAAAPFVPKPLLEQLKPKGFIVMPVGKFDVQEMRKIYKSGKYQSFGNFRFVPFKM